jgi:hypothetical protein
LWNSIRALDFVESLPEVEHSSSHFERTRQSSAEMTPKRIPFRWR